MRTIKDILLNGIKQSSIRLDQFKSMSKPFKKQNAETNTDEQSQPVLQRLG